MECSFVNIWYLSSLGSVSFFFLFFFFYFLRHTLMQHCSQSALFLPQTRRILMKSKIKKKTRRRGMDGAEPKGGVALTAEETPPEETNSTWNHTHTDGTTDGTTEATAQGTDMPMTPQKQERGGPVIVHGNNKSPASEKLERVRKWSVSTYKCTRQALAEKLGRGSRTVDLDLEPRLELLTDDRRRYDDITKLAQTLANQLAQFTVTQKTLGDAFTELSMKTPTLHLEFAVNADAQKFLSKSGQTLTEAINTFTSDMNTLTNKTIQDTMINAKQYQAARMEYDAYRVDLEELNLGPRDTVTLPKLEEAQKSFQIQRDRYQKNRDDLSIKLKVLEGNKVRILQNHLWLLHSAVASHCLACHSYLEQNIQQTIQQLGQPGVDTPQRTEHPTDHPTAGSARCGHPPED
ncbi:arfaptin-1-like isoform X1 [Sphaeramia orbicularis]|uniref:Arfaptin-1-like n=2 Tax=Sphaeramia orbicularis TaxID=375764 RepID=A0A672ZBQ7_9TELE|nr:arfaptin-1-like isoform X1 [Sphaeramia orbicularis]